MFRPRGPRYGGGGRFGGGRYGGGGGRWNYGGYAGRQSGMALYLLASQMLQVGLDQIPPVTLFSILGQIAVFVRLIPLSLRRGLPAIRDVCISSHAVFHRHDFKRLILAPFFHLDDWHLYYNMVSFLWKGKTLESELGSAYFGYMIAVFSVLTSALTAALGLAAQEFSGNDHYAYQCAAGFSGVIFALKVLTTYNSRGSQLVMGFIPVPGPYICWAELFIIQMITPNVSFIGHLAGIIVGLMYIKGPLKSIMESVVSPRPSYTYTRGSSTTYGSAGPQPRRNTGRGTGGGASGGSFWPFNDEGATGHRQQPSYTYTSGTTDGNSNRQNAPSGSDYGHQPRQNAPPGSDYGHQSRQNAPSGSDYGHQSRQNAPSGSDYGHQPGDRKEHYAFTGGLTEEEQMRRAMEESRRTHASQRRPEPSAPVYPPHTAPPSYEEVTSDSRNNLYPDLHDVDEVRRRRLMRFASSNQAAMGML